MTPHQLRDRGEILFRLVCEIFEIKESAEGAKRRDQIDFPSALREFASRAKPKRSTAGTALDKRMKWVGQTLGLDAVEQSILGIMARVGMHDEWGELVAAIPGKGHSPSAGKLALLAGITPSRIEVSLAPGSRLSGTGLVDRDGDGEYSAGAFLLRIARSSATLAQLSRQLIPPAQASTLKWEDFEHLGPQRDIARRLVIGGAGSAILLYGPPGTGKTEFARLLATLSGAKAVFAGESDDDGQEPSRNERLAHLVLLRALTRNDAERIVVVDEADDVLELGRGESRGRRSKLWLNRLVESSERPTVWIVNEPGCVKSRPTLTPAQ
jgi:transitional endoplasmic reticulum ATPase